MKMEVKEAEKVVIAKPVASRPASSSFRSFSDLLAGGINVSPSNESSETAVTTAIRPRTMRFKPGGKHPAVSSVTSQVFEPDRKSNVVYKPMAKPVSRTTVPAFTNMQGADVFDKEESSEIEDVQKPNLVDHRTDFRSEPHHKFPSGDFQDLRSEHSAMSSEILEEDHKSASHIPVPPSFGDRPSYDGYNWRKYGQKQVKGSEYPRSYYKCTHPNCPVKKKVERFLNGEISEIVYKGEHNHPKPRPIKRNSSDEHLQGTTGKTELKQPPWYNQQSESERRKGATQSRQAFGFSGRVDPFLDEAGSNISFGASPLYNSSCRGGELAEATNALQAVNDELMSKRRKYNDQSNEPGTSAEGSRETNIVQHAIDSTIISDGFRWRKYGQKVVKGNPYPRSYYRCTSLKCNVRKYVERTSDEPNAFITTYEGKHNHEMPIKNTFSAASSRTSSKGN